MRLATIKTGDTETAAIVFCSGALPLGAVNAVSDTAWPTDLLSLLEQGLLRDLWTWFRSLDGDALDVFAGSLIPPEQISYGPLYRKPRKIWGIGLNYAEHAGDLSETAPSEEPASFMRPDTSIIGPGDEIKLPPQSDRVTGEAELGVVIGWEAKDISERAVPSVIAGFTTILDMTAEDILRRNPRYLTRSKSFDTFFSFGPQLLTPDEVGELGELEVQTLLNGEVLRRNTVSSMMFSPSWLVSFHSKVMTLLPGDVISTGTPGAVVIEDRDVLGCRIDGFEPLYNPVRR